jgi:hypothetical protein
MDATEKLSQMMIRCGLATGHGDTIDDLIFELEKQIKNTSNAFSDARKQIAQLRESLAFISMLTPLSGQSWESHAKFINAYAIHQLEEEE